MSWNPTNQLNVYYLLVKYTTYARRQYLEYPDSISVKLYP